MRSRDELKDYRRDLAHTDDSELCANIDRLMDGDESVREIVETALDEIDHDLTKYDEE